MSKKKNLVGAAKDAVELYKNHRNLSHYKADMFFRGVLFAYYFPKMINAAGNLIKEFKKNRKK